MACRHCDPDLSPTGSRRGEHHFSVRFGVDWALYVFKDGQEIRDCYELDIYTGRAWRVVMPARACECGEGAEAYIDSGSFSVATVAAGV